MVGRRVKRITDETGDGWKIFKFVGGGGLSGDGSGDNDGDYVRRVFDGIFNARVAVKTNGGRLWGRVFVFCTECSKRLEMIEPEFIARSPFANDEQWSRSVCVMTTCGLCERSKNGSWSGLTGFTPAIDWITDRVIFRDVVKACQDEGGANVEIVRRVLDRRAIAGPHAWPLIDRFISTECASNGKTEFVRGEDHIVGWL